MIHSIHYVMIHSLGSQCHPSSAFSWSWYGTRWETYLSIAKICWLYAMFNPQESFSRFWDATGISPAIPSITSCSGHSAWVQQCQISSPGLHCQRGQLITARLHDYFFLKDAFDFRVRWQWKAGSITDTVCYPCHSTPCYPHLMENDCYTPKAL